MFESGCVARSCPSLVTLFEIISGQSRSDIEEPEDGPCTLKVSEKVYRYTEVN